MTTQEKIDKLLVILDKPTGIALITKMGLEYINSTGVFTDVEVEYVNEIYDLYTGE